MVELDWQEKLATLNTFASSMAEVTPREGELSEDVLAILGLVVKDINTITDAEITQIELLYSRIFARPT
jgi:hypothetical protein